MSGLITREADYALRILRTLSEGGQVTAAEITQRELIPRQFAYKILRKLSRAGIIAVNRGAEGGCRLAADLREKSLFDLMAALDLVELVNACMAPGYQCSWRQSCGRDCKMKPIINPRRTVYQAIIKFLLQMRNQGIKFTFIIPNLFAAKCCRYHI